MKATKSPSQTPWATRRRWMFIQLSPISLAGTSPGLRNPTRITDVIASGLDQYEAVFVPGGHGPMMDLLDDPGAGAVMRHFHETSKPTAVLCHGPISLLSALPNSTEVVAALAAGDAAGARAKAQGWIYAGYKMTI